MLLRAVHDGLRPTQLSWGLDHALHALGILTTVTEIPPFPLSLVKVHLRAGPRAPLISPPGCGPHGTEATLYPSSGAAPLHSVSTFQITSGPAGGPCPGPLPFAPGFEAGAQNSAAGAYSPFSLRLPRIRL